MKLGLEKKALIFTLTILLVIFGIFGYLGLEAVQSSTELALNERLTLAETVAANIDGTVTYARGELEQMAARATLTFSQGTRRVAPAAPINTCLTMCHDRSRVNVSRVGVTDERGELLFLEPHQEINLEEHKSITPAIRTALLEGKTVITQTRPQDERRDPTITIVTPLRPDTNNVRGALVMEIDPLASVGSMITSPATLPAEYHIQVIDNNGIVVRGDGSGSALYSHSENLLYVLSLLEAKKPGMLTHTRRDADGESKHIIAFAPLKTLPWGIVVERRPDRAPLLPELLQRRLLVLSGVLLLVGLAMATVVARRVVKPIAALTVASEKIASGNLDEPIRLKGEKEIETLASAFDDMRTKLKASQAEVAGWQKELENRVERRTKELSALIDSSRELSASLDPGRVVEVIMARAEELFPEADAGILFLWDASKDCLVSAACFGFRSNPPSFSLKAGEDYAGQVFDRGQGITVSPGKLSPQFLPSVSIDNLRNLHPDDLGFEAREVMAVPLIYQTKPTGSLVLYNLKATTAFSPQGLHLLQGLANQGAIAIENSRLFKEAALVGTLRELERMKTEFVARASHELRTPLTSIKSLVETLLRPELRLKPKDQREFLENINSASDRLARIITNLLTISKIEAGKIDIKPVPTSVASVIHGVVEEFRAQAGPRRLLVKIAAQTATVLADPDKLAAVLNNLLANSVKYSPPNSTIAISAENAGASSPSPGLAAARPGVIVSVTDEGSGIPVEEQSKLFHRFSRPDTPSNRTVPGVGLGLYICRSYIEAMGGRIWVKSAPGAGATFSFTLPATDSAPVSSRADSPFFPSARRGPVPARADHSGKSVLVVDDEPDVTRALAVNLAARGVEALIGSTGGEALQIARQRKPDAIILDIMLPDINGLDIARTLKSDPSTATIPIIFLSARAQKEDQARGIEAGAEAYITKPFSTENLWQVLQRLLRA